MSRHSDRIASLHGEERNEINGHPPPIDGEARNEDATEQEPPSRRKATRNRVLRRFLRKRRSRNHKLAVTIPPSHRRAVGLNSQTFITEAGIVARMGPIPTQTWKDLHEDHKKNMLDRLTSSFDIPIEAHANVLHQLNKQYNQWKHHLFKRFQKNRDDCPPGMSEEDWNELCHYFDNDADFKARSIKNKGNRAKLAARHRCGTKSFARVEIEMTEENDGVTPNAINFWRRTHQEADGTWVDQRAEDIMTRLEEAARTHEETHEPGDPPLSLEEHLARVIPPRVGYQGGRGWGPRPGNAVLTRQRNIANEELRAQNAQLENRIEELEAQLQAQVEQQNIRIQEAEDSIERKVQAALQRFFQAQVAQAAQAAQTAHAGSSI